MVGTTSAEGFSGFMFAGRFHFSPRSTWLRMLLIVLMTMLIVMPIFFYRNGRTD